MRCRKYCSAAPGLGAFLSFSPTPGITSAPPGALPSLGGPRLEGRSTVVWRRASGQEELLAVPERHSQRNDRLRKPKP